MDADPFAAVPMAKPPGSAPDPFANVPVAKPAAPAPRPAAPPQSRPAARSAGAPDLGPFAGVKDYAKRLLSPDPGTAGAFDYPGQYMEDYGRRRLTALGNLESDVSTPTKPGVLPEMKRAGKTALDAMDYAWSPVSGAYDFAVGRPVESVTGGKVPRQTAGDIAQILGPFAEVGMAAKAPEAVKMAAARKAVRAGELRAEAKAARAAEHEGGALVGNEVDPVTRLDNALFRLGGHATADKVEMMHFLKGLPKEVMNPQTQERLYTAIEQQMANPKAKIPKDLKPAFDAFKSYYKEQTAIINRLRARNDPTIEPLLEGQGYVARRAVGHHPAFDALDPTERPRDPILGSNRSLTKTTTALKRRNFFVLEGPDGKRTFVQPDRAETKEWKPGMQIRGSDNQPYTVKPATTAEIEANTETRYHKNALVNTVDNVLRLRRVERNMDVLDAATKGLEEKGLAHRDEWHYRNDDGELVLRRASTKTPEGFVQLPHIPQLRGWSFDPKIADVLKDYRPPPDEPADILLQKINRMLTASLFITPVPHAMNVAAHWAVGRGWDWMTPGGYKRLMQTGARAIGEVWGMGPKYQQMLREGSGMLYADTQTRNFYQLMLQKAGGELFADPQAFGEMKRAFGLGDITPVQLAKKVYAASSKALWFSNDIFMLQRQMELEQKGMSTRAAIAAAEKDIPNYRVPSRVMGSRELKQILTNNKWMMFGRYKYGQIRAWGSMFRDLYKGTGEERTEALGKFLAAAIIGFGAYPIADAAVQHLTGNKDARLKRAGPFSLTDAASRLEKGQIGFAQAVSAFLSPSPALEAAESIANNRDTFSGRALIEPQSTTAGKIAQGAEFAGQQFYPTQLGLEAMRPGGAASAAGRLVGIENPPPARAAARIKGKKRDRAMARSREKRDPLTRKLKEAGIQ